ncbi:Lysine-specific histone demethylase 1 2 [Trifolium repens]|nr:Lysine-specific histone demethylase 1 2 [Trifolium repens]
MKNFYCSITRFQSKTGKQALPFKNYLHRVLVILKGIFQPKGITVPDPIQSICTRWGSDPLSYGSYSHVSVHSSGQDYDILAENVGNRLFFAGEATCRQYPATMHGAFMSGLREASRIYQLTHVQQAALVNMS